MPERVDIHTDEYLSARSFRGGRRWGYGRGYYDTRITRSGGYYVELPLAFATSCALRRRDAQAGVVCHDPDGGRLGRQTKR